MTARTLLYALTVSMTTLVFGLATMVLAMATPVEMAPNQKLVPRRTTKSTSTKVHLSKTQRIILGAVVGGLVGLVAFGLACAVLRTYIKTRRMNRTLARKDRIERSQAKPEDLEAVNQYPELFETSAHQPVNAWNVHTITEAPPPFTSTIHDRSEKDGSRLDGVDSEKAPQESWKQGTTVAQPMPEPTWKS